jgi:hypothetical protein
VDDRRKDYIYYQNPIDPIKKVTDPYQHAMMLAAYNTVNGRMLGLLSTSNLTAEQLAAEKQARTAMMDAVKVEQMSVTDGAFHPELMEKVMTAINDYRRAQGDPATDAKKADLARKVLQTASDFLAKVDSEKWVAMNKYIAKLTDILNSDQKNKVAEAGSRLDASGKPIANNKATPKRAPAPAAPGTPVNRPTPPKPQPVPANAG